MFDQNAFTETIREVKEIVRTSERPLTDDEMLAYFSEMKLSGEQKRMVIDYLLAPEEEPVSEAAGNESGEGVDEPSKAFTMYLKDLQNIKEYTEEELQVMYEALLMGDQSLIAKLCDANLAKVAFLAEEYANEKTGIEDIIQEGNMAMFIRLSELCGMGADCGYDVEEELSEAVNDAMKQYVGEIMGEDNSKDAILGKANLVNEAKRELREQLGEEPTAEQLADYTRLSMEELGEILEFVKGIK